MQLQHSLLQLKHKHLNKLLITTHVPKQPIDDDIPVKELDFDIFIGREDKNDFILSVHLKVNSGKKKVIGYVIDLKADYSFNIDSQNSLAEKIYDNFIYSSLSIAIADIRAILAGVTASYQFGLYQLPAINMPELMKAKHNALKKTANK